MWFSLHHIVEWVCWRSNVFASSSVGSYTAQQLKSMRCYIKHLEKQHWIRRHLTGKCLHHLGQRKWSKYGQKSCFHYPQNLSEMSWRCSLLNSLTNGLRGTCFLYLDNMPCSVALNVREFLAKHTVFQWLPICPTHHTGHPVTSSSAPGWRSLSRKNSARWHGNITQYIWQLHWEVEELLQSWRTIREILLWRR